MLPCFLLSFHTYLLKFLLAKKMVKTFALLSHSTHGDQVDDELPRFAEFIQSSLEAESDAAPKCLRVSFRGSVAWRWRFFVLWDFCGD